MKLAIEVPHINYGSAIFVKPDQNITSVSSTNVNNIEILTVEIGQCTVTSVYKPPGQEFVFDVVQFWDDHPVLGIERTVSFWVISIAIAPHGDTERPTPTVASWKNGQMLITFLSSMTQNCHHHFTVKFGNEAQIQILASLALTLRLDASRWYIIPCQKHNIDRLV